jgi:hypothetical protein
MHENMSPNLGWAMPLNAHGTSLPRHLAAGLSMPRSSPLTPREGDFGDLRFFIAAPARPAAYDRPIRHLAITRDHTAERHHENFKAMRYWWEAYRPVARIAKGKEMI